MLVKEGAVIAGLLPPMRKVLRAAETVWKQLGRAEGVTVTSGLDGVHSAASWHPFGGAIDVRTKYANKGLGADIDSDEAAEKLKNELGGDFDIIIHDTHIHVEISNYLAMRLKVLY